MANASTTAANSGRGQQPRHQVAQSDGDVLQERKLPPGTFFSYLLCLSVPIDMVKGELFVSQFS